MCASSMVADLLLLRYRRQKIPRTTPISARTPSVNPIASGIMVDWGATASAPVGVLEGSAEALLARRILDNQSRKQWKRESDVVSFVSRSNGD